MLAPLTICSALYLAPAAPQQPEPGGAGIEAFSRNAAPTSSEATTYGVNTDLSGRKATLWVSHTTDDQSLHAYEEREVALSFWPTSVSFVDGDTFILAGYNQRGFAIVEQWEISGLPTVLQWFNPASGEVELSTSAPSVHSRNVLWLDNDPQYGPVDAMDVGWDGGQLAIHFQGNKSIFALDLGASLPQLSTLIEETPSSGSGAFAFSGLSSDLLSLRVRHHADLGEVLYMKWPNPEMRFAFDYDRDRDFDFADMLTEAEWFAMELDIQSKYGAY